MPNMSYCRFQNTAGDFSECVDAIGEYNDLSGDEQRAADRLYTMAKEYVESYEEQTGVEDDDDDN